MASELWVRDSGNTPRKIKSMWVKDAGSVWRQLKALWIRDGSVWRKVFQYFEVTGYHYYTSLNSAANPTVLFASDGTVWTRNNAGALGQSDDWGLPTTTSIGSLYWIRVTFTSGNAATGSLGTWINISTEPVWSMTAASIGNSKVSYLAYQISTDSGGSVVVGSGTITLESER